MYAVEPVGLVQPYGKARGWQELVPGTSPAAGAEFTYSIDGRWTTRAIAVTCRLVSDGNAANRNVHVHFENPSGTVYTFTATSLQQAASKTVDYSFIAGVGANLSVTDLHAVSPLPPPFLRPTDIIRIAVTNIQATDQLSRIFLVLERYPTDGPPYIDTAPGR